MAERNNQYHCSGCARLAYCKLAFKKGSKNCDLYVRNSYHQCHKCLRFGRDCQRSGLVKCKFTPRVPESNQKDMDTQERRQK